MSGLLSGVLPYVYQQGNKLRGLLSDPVAAGHNKLADMATQAGGLLALHREATAEGMTYGPATNKLAGLLADSYNPVGMTAKVGKAAEPYTGPTMQEIAALNDVPTVEVMRRAMDTVGREEFERQARAYIHEMSRGGKFSFPESMGIEATARKIVAESQRR